MLLYHKENNMKKMGYEFKVHAIDLCVGCEILVLAIGFVPCVVCLYLYTSQMLCLLFTMMRRRRLSSRATSSRPLRPPSALHHPSWTFPHQRRSTFLWLRLR